MGLSPSFGLKLGSTLPRTSKRRWGRGLHLSLFNNVRLSAFLSLSPRYLSQLKQGHSEHNGCKNDGCAQRCPTSASPSKTKSVVAPSQRLGRVGIDTLHLHFEELQSLEQLQTLHRTARLRLYKEFGKLGIAFRWYRPKWPGQTGVQFYMRLSVAKVANRLHRSSQKGAVHRALRCRRHAHNSHPATYDEVLQILRVIKGIVMRHGVIMTPGLLKVIRLDLFVDALLAGRPCDREAMKQLLLTAASCSRLKGSQMYPTGLNGFGRSYGWIFYGKGIQLLQEARKGRRLRLLVAERSVEKWESLFRLEMRWQKAAAVRRALPLRPGSIAALDAEATSLQPSVQSVLMNELLERWDELPGLFVMTARKRCLRWSSDSLVASATKTKRAQAKNSRAPTRARADSKRSLARASKVPLCPVERVLHRLRKAVGEGADWAYIESLIPPDAPSAGLHQGGLTTSSSRLFRDHLRTLPALTPQRVSTLSLDFERALALREAAHDPDFLERYSAFEAAFGLHVSPKSIARIDNNPVIAEKPLYADATQLVVARRVIPAPRFLRQLQSYRHRDYSNTQKASCQRCFSHSQTRPTEPPSARRNWIRSQYAFKDHGPKANRRGMPATGSLRTGPSPGRNRRRVTTRSSTRRGEANSLRNFQMYAAYENPPPHQGH